MDKWVYIITAVIMISVLFSLSNQNAFGAVVAWDKPSYKICDYGIITFNGQEENTNPNLVQIFFIQVTSDSDPIGVEVLMLETGNDSGVFTGEVQLCGDLNVSAGDKVYVLYGNIGDAASIESTTITSITVSTDKTSYRAGDMIRISGNVGTLNENFQVPVTILMVDSTGNIFFVIQAMPNSSGDYSHSILTGEGMESGTYEISAQYGAQKALTEFYFVGTTTVSCGPDEVIVGGVCVNAFDYPITVSTDRTSYSDGDTIRISGNVGTLNENPNVAITMWIIDPIGETIAVDQGFPSSDGSYSFTLRAGGIMQTGEYEITVQYGSKKSTTTFSFSAGGFTPPTPLPTTPNTVFAPAGSGVPGCERTNECFIPAVITVNVGDTVKWVNKDSDAHTVTHGFAATGPDGAFDSSLFMAGATFSWTAKAAGEYPYFCLVHPWMEGTVIVKGTSSGIVDTTPPLLLTPSDMTVDASDSSGARVSYSVKAIDDIDGVLKPKCSPSSGTLFKIGNTGVTCFATDSSGNSDRKSFLITVNPPDVVIPSWIKDVAGFWCGDEIDDNSFIEAIEYLINNDVIIVPATASGGSGPQEIPNWIKSNACWWSQGLITNSDFASGLQYLIGQGIIRV